MVRVKIHAGGAIRDLDNLVRTVDEKTDLLLSRLADIGMSEAKVSFDSFALTEWFKSTGAHITRNPNVDVTVEPTERGYAVVASGAEVAFIEFGAGVYYNGAEGYKGERPPGIVGIGQYGMGHGEQPTWGFYRDSEVVLTHGNPASNSMYYAAEAIRQRIEEVAREVFA